MQLKDTLTKHIANIPGWRTSRKIVVFESDDWGSIRIPSREVYEQLLRKGIRVDKNYFTRNDTLEDEADLESLFEVLTSCKDGHGRNPVFTALTIVANPDFAKIKASDFKEYHYETVEDTLKAYGNRERVLDLWRQGVAAGVYRPQFHGREHLNVQRWMRGLNNPGLKVTKLAFDLHLTGIHAWMAGEQRGDYQAAFDIDYPEDKTYLEEVLRSGLELFERYLGYRSLYFVPTNGPFNSELETILAQEGIKYINSAKIQREPLGNGKFSRNFRFLGQQNRLKQIYLNRNAFFEPSRVEVSDWVDKCLKEIAISFRWKKPAVISTHRVNYIGGINPENRSRGLKSLKELLGRIVKLWPEVEFMSSDRLGALTDTAP